MLVRRAHHTPIGKRHFENPPNTKRVLTGNDLKIASLGKRQFEKLSRINLSTEEEALENPLLRNEKRHFPTPDTRRVLVGEDLDASFLTREGKRHFPTPDTRRVLVGKDLDASLLTREGKRQFPKIDTRRVLRGEDSGTPPTKKGKGQFPRVSTKHVLGSEREETPLLKMSTRQFANFLKAPK